MTASATRGTFTIAIKGCTVTVKRGSRILRCESYATADEAGATYHNTVDTYTAILSRRIMGGAA